MKSVWVKSVEVQVQVGFLVLGGGFDCVRVSILLVIHRRTRLLTLSRM